MKAQGPWIVVKCDLGTSKVTGGDMTTITMINQQLEITHTYVEHTNNNYKHWTNVIDCFDRGWGVTIDNLRYKVKSGEIQQRHIKIYNVKENLIDADSKPIGVAVEDTLQEAVDKFFEGKF